ncbi:hypothetical protein NEOLI_002387 [Neolecta irregularis DAH-3]|uniref:Uncharacterized protein n=1 Tax=Neolecta irregularis (strain DAH-3) TaxID=1198029 RepID=A0A1U7LUD6_NEOID|nr:hypothetical protein NEOLI_002387 [Neolecta irregularis DAH-3]|eukprot:OLL26239.1 hypothetical protein NEOLI_002387 [Neolecta irregularis DAH-3]
MSFNPDTHLCFSPPESKTPISSFGMSSELSPIAYSSAFPLFTLKALEEMRREVMSPGVWQHCKKYNADKTQMHLRGMCPNLAPFITAAWKHPLVLEALSSVAGIGLEPIIDYEIGETHIQQPNASIVQGWHRKPYPFLCIIMLSPNIEIGGEILIQDNRGRLYTLEPPKQGYAILIQSRLLQMMSVASKNGAERITMSTAFTLSDPRIFDDSSLNLARPLSNPNELYTQWVFYRFGKIERLLHSLSSEIQESGRIDKEKFRAACDRIKGYLTATYNEIR